MTTLKQYYGNLADAIESRVKTLTFIQHSLTRGLQNEQVLREFLRNYVPKRFTVATGFVAPRAGLTQAVEFSRQIDILIYDSLLHPPIIQVGNVVVCSSDSVVAAIEVKSTLYSSSLEEALRNIAVVKAVDPRINGYIFAFKASAREATIRKRLNRAVEAYGFRQLPDAICVLDGHFIERRGDIVYKVETRQDQLALFYYRIMQDLAAWANIPEIGQGFEDLGERRYTRLI